jgi:Protein of unknown function (DUF2842)
LYFHAPCGQAARRALITRCDTQERKQDQCGRPAPISAPQGKQGIFMTIRTRKLVGTILLVLFLAIYSLLAMVAATAVPINSNKLVELIYFIVAGTVWVIPAGILIKWMQKS